MAQTGYTPISIYYSATATNTPTAGNLVAGELALNTADGKLFYKDSSGVVQTIASKATAALPTTTTGSGAIVLATSPTITTPTVATTMSVGGATPSASGSGITFPATQSASSDANTLDDYEEGTFTCTVGGGTTNPTIPVTATGNYVKIGSVVTVRVNFSNYSNLGASGQVIFTGLPFTSSTSSVASIWTGRTDTSAPYVINISASSTTVSLLNMFNGNAVSWISTGTGTYTSFSITYLTST